jgi:NADH-quinone oxidoreductase subunit E
VSFFTDEFRVRAKEIVARYPRPKSAILPLAHLAQDQGGWLSPEAMAEIAELTGVSAADVQGTCSFYTMFKRRPCGRLVVSVCTNVTCLVTGGPEVLEHLEHRYATDPDVTVEEVECLAACGGAPAMQVNYEFHEKLSPEGAQEIVEEYRTGARVARTISGATV